MVGGDYITELQDSEAKFYFYHLSNYLGGLNDGLEEQNRFKFSFPLPWHSTVVDVIQTAGLNPDPGTHQLCNLGTLFSGS